MTGQGSRMPTPPSTSRRVLVAEDELLIALTIETELTDAGHLVVGPFSSCSDAERWLATDTPDVAVLDIQLSDGPCIELALDLQRRGVPFVVLTGNPLDYVAPVFAGAPIVEKPASLDRLAEIVSGLALGFPRHPDSNI